MSVKKPGSTAKKSAPGVDPSARIRFDEPQPLPIKLMVMVAGGVLLVAAIAFVGLYKLNVKKVDNTPPVPTLGIPDKGALNQPAPTAMTPVAPSAAASLPGTRVEPDGAVVVVEPNQCTYLKLHLQNLAEMTGNAPDAALQEWVRAKQSAARERMAVMGC